MKRDLIKINDLSRLEIEELIKKALALKKQGKKQQEKPLQGKVVAVLFFEASTRTRLSFEAAVQRLGGRVIGFADSMTTSYSKKGESLNDTIKVVSQYADLIVIRHPQAGAAQQAADAADIPVINAGDGANEHPTQTLLDLMSIYETQDGIDGLKIAMVGDLKYGRVPRSLSRALAKFDNVKICFISPSALKMEDDIKDEIKPKLEFIEIQNMEDPIPSIDVLYLTRIQYERFENLADSKKYRGKYVLTKEMLKKAKDNLKVMHALPRNEELPVEIDKTPYAYYFDQVENGMYMRMALLKTML